MNNAVVFDEPLLEFGAGGKMQRPRDGLAVFGPADSDGVVKPALLSYGVVGTQNGVAAFCEFAKALGRPVLTADYLDENLWPHFPGFEAAFHAQLPAEPAWVEELDTLELKNAATERDDHKRAFEVVSLFLERVRAAKTRAIGFFVVVVPDFVFTNCRPVPRFQGGHGRRVSKREQRLRALMRDFFEDYEPEHYAWSPDFRFQLKARAMDLGIVVQIVRESTLRLPRAERRVGGRQLTPLSDRAWNLATAFYYKSGGKPWRWGGARAGLCHAGVFFKDDEAAGTVYSAAQVFQGDGDGLVIPGDEGGWFTARHGEYHLNDLAARHLLSAVIENHRPERAGARRGEAGISDVAERGRTKEGKATVNHVPARAAGRERLSEICLHTRSTLNEKELEGYLAACPAGVKLTVVRVAPERSGLRLLRAGRQPVLRGTFCEISPRRGLLWTSGFKPQLRAYDGFEIPQPLQVEVQHGDCDVVQAAKDILALTKLNYNGCRLGEYQPVTTHFSRIVGEILFSHRTPGNPRPEFRYYV